MTCYLTSRDDRFAAAVAGGVVSDLVSMGGTSDDAHCSHATSSAVSRGRSATATRRCRRSPAWTSVVTPTLVYHGEADRPLPRRPGAAVVHGAARARRTDAARPLPGRRAPVHPRRAALAPSRLQPPRHRLGGAVCRQHAARVAATARRRALAPPAGRPGGAPPRPRREPRHSPRRRRSGRDLCGRLRPAQQDDRRRDDRRLRLPDRLDDQGLDGDGRDAARRRGQARSRRADRRRAARAGARGSGRGDARHDAPPSHAHERHRRRRLHRHGARRRLPRALRRPAGGSRAEPPPRRPPGRTATPASSSRVA